MILTEIQIQSLIVCGPVFFCGIELGDDGEEFRGLDDDEIHAVEFLYPYLKGEKS